MRIQWYPGHMAKAKRILQDSLPLVDMVFELLDARIPLSSQNPDLKDLLGAKPRLIVLNKADLANPEFTAQWIDLFRKQGLFAVPVNSLDGKGIKEVFSRAREAMEPKMQALAAKGIKSRAIRAMIVGIPNVGKSSLINRLTGRAGAKTGDRPGVTKSKQWLKVGNDFELLDTPGVLWPKFEDQEVGLKLAATGAISDDVFDLEFVAYRLIEILSQLALGALVSRYGLGELTDDPRKLMDEIALKRGCLRKGGEIDYLKVSKLLLHEFRGGKIGRITLDLPSEKSLLQ